IKSFQRGKELTLASLYPQNNFTLNPVGSRFSFPALFHFVLSQWIEDEDARRTLARSAADGEQREGKKKENRDTKALN
ncbi:hypothetical protein ALC53_04109, partial [Atta colombica]